MRHSTAKSAIPYDAFHVFAFHDSCGIGESCSSRVSRSDLRGRSDVSGGKSGAAAVALTTAAMAPTMPATAAACARVIRRPGDFLGSLEPSGPPVPVCVARAEGLTGGRRATRRGGVLGFLDTRDSSFAEDACMEDQRVVTRVACQAVPREPRPGACYQGVYR
jgi:hypothetical protein